MATVAWNPNAQATSQVSTITVTAVALNGTLTATINGKTITYTCVSGETTTTAATAWFNLLSSTDAPPEFQEIDWTNPSAAVILATAGTPGTPFTLTKSQAGGATCNLAITTANSSPNDVGDSDNWLRGGAAALPQANDDVIIANSDVSLLWNLDALAAIRFNTFQRWQTFTGQIGLPEINANGYMEYRPTYFKFLGPSGGTLTLQLGIGSGDGPVGERYDLQAQRTNVLVENVGSIASGMTYNVRFLGTNANNTIKALNGTIASGMLPGEAPAFASGTVDGGASLYLGVGASWSGNMTVTGAAAFLYATPGSLTVRDNSTVTLSAPASGLTFPTVTVDQNSSLVLLGPVTISTVTALEKSSRIDNSNNLSLVVIGAISTMDGDTCQIIDPNSTIVYNYPITVVGPVTTGPFQFTGTKLVQIS